jgi:hypothetical protein
VDGSCELPESPELPEFFGTNQQEFVFDDLGRLVKAVDHTSELTGDEDITAEFRYDTAGRKLHENQTVPLGQQSYEHLIESEYARDGFRTMLEFSPPPTACDPGEEVDRYYIEYTADAVGRLEYLRAFDTPTDQCGVTRQPTELAEYRYVGSRVWSRWYGNGTELRMYEGSEPGQRPMLYDALGRVTGMRTVNGAATVTDFRHDYDRIGNLMYEQRRHEPYSNPTDHYRTRAYTTDYMGRLTAWREGKLPVNPIGVDNADPADAPQDPTDHWSSPDFAPLELSVKSTYLESCWAHVAQL